LLAQARQHVQRHPDAGKGDQIRADRCAGARYGGISIWRHATRILSRRRPRWRGAFFSRPCGDRLTTCLARLASRKAGRQGANNAAVPIGTVNRLSLSTGLVGRGLGHTIALAYLTCFCSYLTRWCAPGFSHLPLATQPQPGTDAGLQPEDKECPNCRCRSWRRYCARTA
jgi:hypothetical protein